MTVVPLSAQSGKLICSESLVWVGREGGLAVKRNPLPLALANTGCAWRHAALDGLDRLGRSYRIAYSSEQCAGQEAALLADLAIAAQQQDLHTDADASYCACTHWRYEPF